MWSSEHREGRPHATDFRLASTALSQQALPDPSALTPLERARLRRAVSALPPLERIVLRDRLGLSGVPFGLAEIAWSLRLPPAAVAKIERRAIRRLRGSLPQDAVAA